MKTVLLVAARGARLTELVQLFDGELADFLREPDDRPTEQGIVLSQQLAKLGTAGRGSVWKEVDKRVARRGP